MAITTTKEFGGAPPVFHGQYKGVIQELPYKTPYDHADRWHLSKLCAKLGIAHKDAERKIPLIQMLLTAEEGGQIDQVRALALLDNIIHQSTRQPWAGMPERQWVELEAPAINGAPPAAPVVPPSPESELWRFAKLTTTELIEEAAKLGLVFTRRDKRTVIMDALEKHLKK